jgi:hypothetical protein
MLCVEGLIHNSQYWLTRYSVEHTNQDCDTSQSTLVDVIHRQLPFFATYVL